MKTYSLTITGQGTRQEIALSLRVLIKIIETGQFTEDTTEIEDPTIKAIIREEKK